MGPAGGRAALDGHLCLAGVVRGAVRGSSALVPGDRPGNALDSVWVTGMTQQIIFFYMSSYQFIEQKAWIAETFPKDRRYENLMVVGEDVLTADTVRYVRIIILPWNQIINKL